VHAAGSGNAAALTAGYRMAFTAGTVLAAVAGHLSGGTAACRAFTEAEHSHNHCQIGTFGPAVGEIPARLNWTGGRGRAA
jgi:hypothetical protein